MSLCCFAGFLMMIVLCFPQSQKGEKKARSDDFVPQFNKEKDL